MTHVQALDTDQKFATWRAKALGMTLAELSPAGARQAQVARPVRSQGILVALAALIQAVLS